MKEEYEHRKRNKQIYKHAEMERQTLPQLKRELVLNLVCA